VVGTPLIVTTFADHTALTPSGRPVAAPIPEIPVVEWVIFVRSLLIFNVGVEEVGVTEVQAQCFAGEFERWGSSGGVFNAVYAAFRRSVSRRFERGYERGFEKLWTGFNLEYTERMHLWFYLSDPLTSYYCWWLSKITRPCRNYFLWMSKKNQSYS